MDKLAVEVVAVLGNLACFNRFKNGATGFCQVMAVVETAVAKVWTEFPKSPLEHAFCQMVKSKFLKSR